MANITLEPRGSRIYLRGNTYPIKNQIRKEGGRWDAEEKAWWVGASDEQVFAKLVETLAPSSINPDRNSGQRETVGQNTEVRGKVAYRGRTYYLLCSSRDGSSHKVCTLDGQMVFWAKEENGAQIVKHYTDWSGYPTLYSIGDFIDDLTSGSHRDEDYD